MSANDSFHKPFDLLAPGEPVGQRCNGLRWLQKKVIEQARTLPREFSTLADWETFRQTIRRNLPAEIGLPTLPELRPSTIRGATTVGGDVICERTDIYVDEDYTIPAYIFRPQKAEKPQPALVWSIGWPMTKWDAASQAFCIRMARRGFVVAFPDHIPFGETSPAGERKENMNMTLAMGMGNVLGISQLALRMAETMRCGEYLRSRNDVDASRVAVAGICQGGMDCYLAAALDKTFCAAAPICAASTFAVHFAEMASYRANGDASPFPFRILRVCDVEHLHAAIAPRPLLVRANLPDSWWPITGLAAIEDFTKNIYRLYDAEGVLDFGAEAHEHNVTGPFADAIESFLVKYVLEKTT